MSAEKTNQHTFFPLAMAQDGDIVQIKSFNGSKNMEARLTSMGLNVGSHLVVSQYQGNNLVVIRGETRLALGAGMAQKIMVINQA